MGRSQEAKVLLLGPTCDNCLRSLPAQFLIIDAKDEQCCGLVIDAGTEPNSYLIRYHFPPEKSCDHWEEKKQELFRRKKFLRIRKALQKLSNIKVGQWIGM
jgi:hypothetical protein